MENHVSLLCSQTNSKKAFKGPFFVNQKIKTMRGLLLSFEDGNKVLKGYMYCSNKEIPTDKIIELWKAYPDSLPFDQFVNHISEIYTDFRFKSVEPISVTKF